ncbi:nucleotide exchange factor GrpE [Pseudovibrio sp. Tun.PSC04-5.I4]|uniref:nucleotide exchange factor GrpE n=1 Tax=Pseudovibrio sp. Tun.PSC04-5.I4 TaxID=1798213 RepID=UPI0008875D52|nr:nucleotide exchange factor GrpE [Pseudovibrio sp. Tun.PSC04-5.I4]SDR23394.1 molecular chaperone GrpE [Pseudovibrio sp. Tun.PSC04-5.I4]
MSDQNKTPHTEEQLNPEVVAEEVAFANEAEQVEAAVEVDPIEALRAENAALKDRTLRTMAEMENLRRRTEKEVKDAKVYAIAGFARDMLVVNDNLGRAIDALPDEATQNDENLKALVEGVELVEREMLNHLEKHGVKRLSPEGEKFNPHFHQAMFEVPNTEVPNNTVMNVVQAGYVIGERVLRPAMVGISKGGPKIVPVTDKNAGPGSTLDKEA